MLAIKPKKDRVTFTKKVQCHIFFFNWGCQQGFYIPMKVSYSADPNVIPYEYPLGEGTSKIYSLSCCSAPLLRCWVAPKSDPFSSQIQMSPKSAVSEVGPQTFFSLVSSIYKCENLIYTFCHKNQLFVSWRGMFGFHNLKNLLLPTQKFFGGQKTYFVLELLSFNLRPFPGPDGHKCGH